jgi:hypothetical protein
MPTKPATKRTANDFGRGVFGPPPSSFLKLPLPTGATSYWISWARTSRAAWEPTFGAPVKNTPANAASRSNSAWPISSGKSNSYATIPIRRFSGMVKPSWPSLKDSSRSCIGATNLSAAEYVLALREAEAKIYDAALEPILQPRRYPNGKVHRLINHLANRFHEHGEGYFRFIDNPDIQPTTNSVEQAERFVVMDRHVTQGTRSKRGREFCERLWTIMATCALQKRSAYHWMHQAISAYFKGKPITSLLLDSS